jgi:hypothetical protein
MNYHPKLIENEMFWKTLETKQFAELFSGVFSI